MTLHQQRAIGWMGVRQGGNFDVDVDVDADADDLDCHCQCRWCDCDCGYSAVNVDVDVDVDVDDDDDCGDCYYGRQSFWNNGCDYDYDVDAVSDAVSD